MNKLIKIILSILGGMNVLLDVITPLIISLLWIKIFTTTGFGFYLIYIIGFCASSFRGIKYILKIND